MYIVCKISYGSVPVSIYFFSAPIIEKKSIHNNTIGRGLFIRSLQTAKDMEEMREWGCWLWFFFVVVGAEVDSRPKEEIVQENLLHILEKAYPNMVTVEDLAR